MISEVFLSEPPSRHSAAERRLCLPLRLEKHSHTKEQMPRALESPCAPARGFAQFATLEINCLATTNSQYIMSFWFLHAVERKEYFDLK